MGIKTPSIQPQARPAAATATAPSTARFPLLDLPPDILVIVIQQLYQGHDMMKERMDCELGLLGTDACIAPDDKRGDSMLGVWHHRRLWLISKSKVLRGATGSRSEV